MPSTPFDVRAYLSWRYDRRADLAQPGPDGVTLVNCWGLVRAVLGDLGVDVRMRRVRPRGTNTYVMKTDTSPEAGTWAWCLREHASVAVPVHTLEAARLGDVIELVGCDPLDNTETRHVGVCVDAFRFLHASQESGVSLRRIDAARRVGIGQSQPGPRPAARLLAIHRPRLLLGDAECSGGQS